MGHPPAGDGRRHAPDERDRRVEHGPPDAPVVDHPVELQLERRERRQRAAQAGADVVAAHLVAGERDRRPAQQRSAGEVDQERPPRERRAARGQRLGHPGAGQRAQDSPEEDGGRDGSIRWPP
jgi:hypothetical protein